MCRNGISRFQISCSDERNTLSRKKRKQTEHKVTEPLESGCFNVIAGPPQGEQVWLRSEHL